MNVMNRFQLNRRTALRGILGGFSVAVALPPLEAMFNSSARLHGQIPKIQRLGLWFWGNGVKLDRWVPSTTGADWTSPELEPIASSPIKNYVNIVSGMDVKAGNERGHHSGVAAIMSGAAILPQDHPNSNYKSTFRQPTIDQVVANELAPATRFRSLEVGISSRVPSGEGTTLQYLSHNGPDSPNPAEYDAGKVFDRVFAGVTGMPDGGPTIDATQTLRRSVLDAVATDITRLQNRIGAKDKERLDVHLTNIRSIEQRISQGTVAPPPVSCSMQTRPPAVTDTRSKEDITRRNELMSDLLAVTLACDLTRIFSVHFSGSVGSTVYWQADPAISGGHHDLTHNEAGDQPQVHASSIFIMQQLAYFLTKLKNTPDLDGTSILDNVAILASSDVADGKAHSITNYPIIVAGGGSGYLKNPGVHYRSNKENTSNVLLTVMRAAGSNATSVGADKGLSMTPCTAIESGT
jgi:hypothetical protein